MDKNRQLFMERVKDDQSLTKRVSSAPRCGWGPKKKSNRQSIRAYQLWRLGPLISFIEMPATVKVLFLCRHEMFLTRDAKTLRRCTFVTDHEREISFTIQKGDILSVLLAESREAKKQEDRKPKRIQTPVEW